MMIFTYQPQRLPVNEAYSWCYKYNRIVRQTFFQMFTKNKSRPNVKIRFSLSEEHVGVAKVA